MKIVVLGGGPGGYVAALRAAILGADVTVVEKASLGGTCLNLGCVPTKSMLACSGTLEAIQDTKKMGIVLDGTASLDLPAVIARKDKIVTQLVQGIEMLFQVRGVKKIVGTGTLESDGSVTVTDPEGTKTTLNPDKIILATGSVPVVPGIFLYDGTNVITSNEALSLTEIPASLIIVGGGVIGCELGQFFAKCGTKVTIIEALPQLLPNEDVDVAAILSRAFRKDKIAVQVGKRVNTSQITNEGVEVVLEDESTLAAEKLLVCIGRKPNLDNLALEELGIKCEKGKIITDEHMETTHPGIYAIGDLVNSPMLAHVASREGTVAVDHICGRKSAISYKAVPNCIYTSPEIAGVGMNERQLEQAGKQYKSGAFRLSGLGKAKAAGKTDGFIKILVDENDVILGASIVGEHATDMIGELALAVECGLTAEQVGSVIHPHPTMCEGVMEAMHLVHGECVHAI